MADNYDNNNYEGNPYGEYDNIVEQEQPLTPQELEEMSRQQELERLVKLQEDSKVLKESQKAEKQDLQNQKAEIDNQKLKEDIEQKIIEKNDPNAKAGLKTREDGKPKKPTASQVTKAQEAKPTEIQSNLNEQKDIFNPEGDGYDYDSAISAGLNKDETGHWASRNPVTGQILKGKNHPTFNKTLEAEKKAGYEIFKGPDGKYYSKKPKENERQFETAGIPTEGTDIDLSMDNPTVKPDSLIADEMQPKQPIVDLVADKEVDLMEAPPIENAERESIDLSHEATRESMSPEERLMDEFRMLKEDKEKDLNRSRWTDLAANLGRSLAQYGSDIGAAKAGMIGATTIKPKDLGFKPIDTYSRTLGEYKDRKADLLNQQKRLDSENKYQQNRLDKKEVALAKEQEKEQALARQNRLDLLNEKKVNAQIEKWQSDANKKDDTKLSNDPNSESSKIAQAQKSAIFKSLGINFSDEQLAKISEKELNSKQFTAAIRKSVNNIQKAREGRLKDKFGYDRVERFEKDAKEAIDSMRKTDSWKLSEKSLSEIKIIDALLDDAYEKGGQSLAMLGPKVARGIANEVGVLTEQDVKIYVKNPTLVGGLVDTAQKIVAGKISEVSYENLKRLLDITRRTNKDKMEFAIDRESKNFAKREGILYDEARYYLDSEYTKKPTRDIKSRLKDDSIKKVEIKKAPYGDEVERNGKKYKWNATRSKYQLIK